MQDHGPVKIVAVVRVHMKVRKQWLQMQNPEFEMVQPCIRAKRTGLGVFRVTV